MNWLPWGEEALQLAKQSQKPIFLSIGYSACHWCHVMEHESFENEAIAKQLNQDFVCIKVDREERPDLDQLYMTAVQIMTGRGGWPMSVFLTPDLKPFYGGTYWPPHAKMGMPGFDQVLTAVMDAWTNRQSTAIEQAEMLTERIAATSELESEDTSIDAQLLDSAADNLQRTFDPHHGGFGGAPKFPHSMDIQLLLRIWQRTGRDELLQIARVSLDKMAGGGIYDHLGGGFARYSVDERWLVPHFEKMLYDNALLAGAYLDSYLACGDLEHRKIVRETLDYVLRDMTDDAGCFYSTEDADSEGVEGKYYVWTVAEIHEHLPAEIADRFCKVYDVTERGNFEGSNILNLPHSLSEVAKRHEWSLEELEPQMADAKETLRQIREQRVKPGLDDKVIVSWNGLMIDSLARAGRALNDERYVTAAKKAASFIQQQLWRDGRLLHTWRNGDAKLAAYLDDYASLANALVSLYEATFEARWLDWSFELADLILQHFQDPSGGALYYTSDEHEALIARPKDMQDSSVPSGNAMAATVLLRLSHLGGTERYRDAAEQILRASLGLMKKAPAACGQMLMAVDFRIGPTYEIAWVGDPRESPDCKAVLDEDRSRFRPRTVTAMQNPDDDATHSLRLENLFRDREPIDGGPTLYVCRDYTCQAPATTADEIRSTLDAID